MSLFSEYADLVPLALKNKEKILEAVVNKVKDKFGKLSKDEQDEIIRRRLICESCEFNSKNAKELSNYETKRIDDHCILCGCNIDLKTGSLMSNCGIESWNLKNPNEKLSLKWEVYKPK